MSDNITNLPIYKKMSAGELLEFVKSKNPSEVVILSYEEGSMQTRASRGIDNANALWMLSHGLDAVKGK